MTHKEVGTSKRFRIKFYQRTVRQGRPRRDCAGSLDLSERSAKMFVERLGLGWVLDKTQEVVGYRGKKEGVFVKVISYGFVNVQE